MRKRSMMVALVFGVMLAAVMVTQVQAAQWIHVPRMAFLWRSYGPDVAWHANDAECDDNYSKWNSVPKNQIMPTNNLGTHATNLVSDASAAWYKGFTGSFDCSGEVCWVRLCNTDNPGSDPWSVRLGSW